jgi:hypothetical protein
MYAHVGDRLLVEGDESRIGLIIDVPNANGSPPYIVRWLANGHIAMVSPGMFARLIQPFCLTGRTRTELSASSCTASA